VIANRRTISALVWRELRIAASYRASYGIGLTVGMANLLIYFLISRTYGPAKPEDIGSAPSFVAFVAAGVTLSVVLQTAVDGVARRLREEQLSGSLEMLLAAPMRSGEVALGLAGFPLIFALARALLYLALAALLFSLPLGDSDPIGVAAVLLAAIPAFTGLGAMVAALVLVVRRTEVLGGLLVLALGIVGGAYYPVSVLPPAFEAIGRLTPNYYAYEGLRAALYGGEGWADDALVLLGFGAVLVPAGLAAFALGVALLRRRGNASEA
jgi:ABC-2 type transport system permease protein